LDLYRGILRDLVEAYRRGDMEDAGKILDARQQMMALDEAASRPTASEYLSSNCRHPSRQTPARCI
jgi:hypothetical protein